MKIEKALMPFVAAVCLATPGMSADTLEWRDQFDMARAALDDFTMVLMHDGKEAGSMTYGWTKGDGRYIIRDRTEMAPNILETAEAVIDGKSLLPGTVAIDFAVGDDKMDLDLTWQGRTRIGTILSVRNGTENTRDINATEDEDAPLRMAVIGMVAGLKLEDGFSLSLPWFNSMANRTEQISLAVSGGALVDTPAGQFDAWQLDVTGGFPENVIYVTKASPQRIVRIDVKGQPMQFLLTTKKP